MALKFDIAKTYGNVLDEMYIQLSKNVLLRKDYLLILGNRIGFEKNPFTYME